MYPKLPFNKPNEIELANENFEHESSFGFDKYRKISIFNLNTIF